MNRSECGHLKTLVSIDFASVLLICLEMFPGGWILLPGYLLGYFHRWISTRLELSYMKTEVRRTFGWILKERGGEADDEVARNIEGVDGGPVETVRPGRPANKWRRYKGGAQ